MEPAAGRGERAFRQRGHYGRRQKSHKAPVEEAKRQSAGQAKWTECREQERSFGVRVGRSRKGKMCEAEVGLYIGATRMNHLGG